MSRPLYEQNEGRAAERLSRAMSYLDDDLIMEAEATPVPRRRRPHTYAPFLSAACLVLIVGIGFLTFGGILNRATDKDVSDGLGAEPWGTGLSYEKQTTGVSGGNVSECPGIMCPGKIYSLGDQVPLPVFAESSKDHGNSENEAIDGSGVSENPGMPDMIKPDLSAGDLADTVTFLEHDVKAHTVTVRLDIAQNIPPLAVNFNRSDGTYVSNSAQTDGGLIRINVNGRDDPDGQLPTAPGTYTVVIWYDQAMQQVKGDFACFSVGSVYFSLADSGSSN